MSFAILPILGLVIVLLVAAVLSRAAMKPNDNRLAIFAFVLIAVVGSLMIKNAVRRYVAMRQPQVQLRSVPRAIATGLPSTQPTTRDAKFWIADWAGYVNATGFQGFVAESSDICVTELEANEQAIARASENIYQRLLFDPVAVNPALQPLVRSDLLQQHVVAAVRSGQLVVDRAIRQTEKPYGTLWKAYLLIDTSPKAVNPVVQSFKRAQIVQTRRELSAGASLAGLSLVILLLYVFLNAVTKGYFMWRLRAVATMILIMGVLAVFAWGV